MSKLNPQGVSLLLQRRTVSSCNISSQTHCILNGKFFLNLLPSQVLLLLFLCFFSLSLLAFHQTGGLIKTTLCRKWREVQEWDPARQRGKVGSSPLTGKFLGFKKQLH